MKRMLLFASLILLICGCSTVTSNTVSGRAGSQRYHHYVFAHRATPYQVFSEQERTLKAFENDGQAFVERAWVAVGGQAEKNGHKPIEKTGLEFSMEQINDIKIYLIKLPAPTGITEAYFVATAVKNGSVEYFTLERTICIAETCEKNPTVLGGWTNDGKHLNYGKGPEPNKEDFVKSVIGLQQGHAANR
jgi:hypothetical protein